MKNLIPLTLILITVLGLQSCKTKEQSSYDFLVELNTKYNTICKENEGDKLDKETTSFVKKYSNPIIMDNSFVYSIKKVENSESNMYSPGEKKRTLKYKMIVNPYSRTGDGTLVLISDLQQSYGESSGSFIHIEPNHKYLKDVYSYVTINVYDDDLKDGIYPRIRLSKQIYGNEDLSFFVSDVSMKVVLSNIHKVTYNYLDMGNDCEFDLVEVTKVNNVKSELRTKFENDYQFDYKKFFKSESDEVKLSLPDGLGSEIKTDYIVSKKQPITNSSVQTNDTTHVQPVVSSGDTTQKQTYYNGCGYSYESKEDCMNQCGSFNGGTCKEGPPTGQIIKSSNPSK